MLLSTRLRLFLNEINTNEEGDNDETTRNYHCGKGLFCMAI